MFISSAIFTVVLSITIIYGLIYYSYPIGSYLDDAIYFQAFRLNYDNNGDVIACNPMRKCFCIFYFHV